MNKRAFFHFRAFLLDEVWIFVDMQMDGASLFYANKYFVIYSKVLLYTIYIRVA